MNHFQLSPSPSFISIKTIKEHGNWISCLILLKDGRFASSSFDRTIKIFNPSTFHCDISITTGYSHPVMFITQLEDFKLVSCSSNNIKIWLLSKKTYKCLKTIQAHENLIHKVISLPLNRIASCSSDSSIKVWASSTPYECLSILTKQQSPILSILLLRNNTTLVSGSIMGSFCVWDIMTYKFIHKIDNTPCMGNQLIIQLKDNKICVGGMKNINIVNIISFQTETKIEIGFVDSIQCFLTLENWGVLCGSSEGNLYLLEGDSFRFIYVNEKSHDNLIKSLVLIKGDVIASCSFDQTIKIWKYI